MEYSIIVIQSVSSISFVDKCEILIAILAFLASVIALIISVVSLIQNKKINTTNLQARYFEEIFKEYIVKRIPNAVSKIDFQEGRLNKKYKKLVDVMMDMVEHSKYYAYAKHEFYEELKIKTISLEDKLIECASEEIIDIIKQKTFLYSIHEDVMDIIKLINKNYHNF